MGWLVIERSAGESFTVGEDVTVKIVEIRPTTVKIAVSAPKSVAIVRDDAINRERVAR